MIKDNTCPFCKEHFFPYHAKAGLKADEAIIYADDNVFVTPDISPVSEGHYLIVTKHHYCNFAKSPEGVRQSLFRAIRYIREKIFCSEVYLAFEHGSTKIAFAGNSIDHAHVHIIKQEFPLRDAVNKDAKFLEMLTNISLEEYAQKHSHDAYLWILTTGEHSTFYKVDSLESQYLRKKVVNLSHLDYTYNWRDEYACKPSKEMYIRNLLLAKSAEPCKISTYSDLRALRADLRLLSDEVLENRVIELILSSKNELINSAQAHSIFLDNQDGLFYLSERQMKPAFLLSENTESYRDWIIHKVTAELVQLETFSELKERIQILTVARICENVYNILQFKTKSMECFDQIISNQIYSDIFRRIIIFLLTGEPLRIYHSHFGFNKSGKKVALQLLSLSANYDIKRRLHLGVLSGLIGMNIKESLIKTSPCSLKESLNMALPVTNQSVLELFKKMERLIADKPEMEIDDTTLFLKEIENSVNKLLVWIPDDYIEGILELKIAEYLLTINSTLKIVLLPRCDQYSNDLSYRDVESILNEKEFSLLKALQAAGRFENAAYGMDLSTFAPSRMSKQAYALLSKADFVVVVGARAYEMCQGLKKITYYTGIAVCKSYTETITGFPIDSGALIFLRQNPGEHSFSTFKERAVRRLRINEREIPVAKLTTREFYEKKKQS